MKHLGTFLLGHEPVALYCDATREDGDFRLLPGPDGHPAIIVGVMDARWELVLMVLLHETFEFLCARAGLRYMQTGLMAEDPTNCSLLMTHTQFAEICARQSAFVSQVQGALKRAWRQAQSC